MSFFRKKFVLLIVCTANKTRSAYFEAYLKDYLKKYTPGGLRRIKIKSAGTKAIVGGRVNDVVAFIARKNGFSLREHTATRVSAKILKKADLVLTMEQVHKDFINEKFPQFKDKVFRLMEYGWQSDDAYEQLNVPDPTGRDADDFKEFIDTAHAEADRLVHELSHQQII